MIVTEFRYHIVNKPIPEGWRLSCDDLGHHTSGNNAVLIERIPDEQSDDDSSTN